MLTFLASALVSLSLMFGAPVPSTAAQQPAQAAQQAASSVCMEDMECWDADTMGNGESNTTNHVERDAWDSLTAAGVTGSPDMALEYVETIANAPHSYPVGYFAITSLESPQTAHVFHWVKLYYA
jgi:hypothetical protein